MSKTKKPTGLTITRKGMKFTLKWKIADKDYGNGQEVQYRLSGWKGWESITVGKTSTEASKTLSLASFYPNSGKPKLTKVEFRVRGNRKKYKEKGKTINPGWSDWSSKAFEVKAPGVPTLSVEHSETHSNVSTFSWSLSPSDTASAIFTRVEWETILVRESKETVGSMLSWAGRVAGTGGATGSVPVDKTTEDTAAIADASYTRWVRVRASGPAGTTEWKDARYAKHVYAKTYQAKVGGVSAGESEEEGYNVVAEWEATSNAAHPIDSTTVQYTIVIPDEGLTCPSGASWTDADISKDTSGTDKARFSIDDQLSVDECLFVRVNTKHDGNITRGVPVLASTGFLRNPSGLSVVTDDVTHRATITATNNSEVADSFLAVEYVANSDPSGAFIIGIIPHAGSSVTVQCPDWSEEQSVAFGVRAVVGSYTAIQRDGVTSYAVTDRMHSEDTIWDGGAVPQAPTGVTASQTETAGTIRVTWDWTWDEANGAEISWSDHEDAWESTDEPDVYQIDHIHASRWNISGLETGKAWWIRVRLMNRVSQDAVTYGPWSDPIKLDLSSAPSVPVLVLTPSTITEDGSVVASWAYSTTDGTEQAYAEICEAEVSASGVEYGDVIAHTETAQHMDIRAREVGWHAGQTVGLCVRVVSASGRVSDEWSDPVFITVAEPLSASITATSLVPVPEEGINVLEEMPLTVTAEGAGASGETTVCIVRAEDYNIARPDGSVATGLAGEVVAEITQTGEAQMSIGVDDLKGYLDDGAAYYLKATVRDGHGQSADAERVQFEVRWAHQAVMPAASVRIDQVDRAAIITLKVPEGAAEGDVCDIYRLSTDKPELIVEGAALGGVYVDPYPAIGENGGHRVVFKTSNGDYITQDNQIAWIDLGDDDYDRLECGANIIDFGGEEVLFEYNVDVSNKWTKDFRRTKYLGGSVQGDWNAAVERDATVSTVIIVKDDPETQMAMRRLAEYPGICHIRTKDGSSFAGDIQIREELKYSEGHKLAAYTMEVSKCAAQGYDGVTYEQWKG